MPTLRELVIDKLITKLDQAAMEFRRTDDKAAALHKIYLIANALILAVSKDEYFTSDARSFNPDDNTVDL